ncbi:unnamed protein product [Brachionus calyciflorus]|uniref:RING-type domain-containing protein n=1 Tax=Brachionus calyciflorus TaxID=104777 RepID=A0A813WA09_9BILA|nr:unnamed protein product [Brachionus calyciflorus]
MSTYSTSYKQTNPKSNYPKAPFTPVNQAQAPNQTQPQTGGYQQQAQNQQQNQAQQPNQRQMYMPQQHVAAVLTHQPPPQPPPSQPQSNQPGQNSVASRGIPPPPQPQQTQNYQSQNSNSQNQSAPQQQQQQQTPNPVYIQQQAFNPELYQNSYQARGIPFPIQGAPQNYMVHLNPLYLNQNHPQAAHFEAPHVQNVPQTHPQPFMAQGAQGIQPQPVIPGHTIPHFTPVNPPIIPAVPVPPQVSYAPYPAYNQLPPQQPQPYQKREKKPLLIVDSNTKQPINKNLAPSTATQPTKIIPVLKTKEATSCLKIEQGAQGMYPAPPFIYQPGQYFHPAQLAQQPAQIHRANISQPTPPSTQTQSAPAAQTPNNQITPNSEPAQQTDILSQPQPVPVPPQVSYAPYPAFNQLPPQRPSTTSADIKAQVLRNIREQQQNKVETDPERSRIEEISLTKPVSKQVTVSVQEKQQEKQVTQPQITQPISYSSVIAKPTPVPSSADKQTIQDMEAKSILKLDKIVQQEFEKVSRYEISLKEKERKFAQEIQCLREELVKRDQRYAMLENQLNETQQLVQELLDRQLSLIQERPNSLRLGFRFNSILMRNHAQVTPQSDHISIRDLLHPPTQRLHNFDRGRCPICLEPFTLVTSIVATQCGHLFCEACMYRAVQSEFKQCPECRAKLGYNYYTRLHSRD